MLDFLTALCAFDPLNPGLNYDDYQRCYLLLLHTQSHFHPDTVNNRGIYHYTTCLPQAITKPGKMNISGIAAEHMTVLRDRICMLVSFILVLQKFIIIVHYHCKNLSPVKYFKVPI